MEIDYKSLNYTHPIDVFKTNIESIELILNQGDHRKMLEEEIYLVQGRDDQGYKIRTLDIPKYKDDLTSYFDDNMLLFQLTTTYIDPKTGESTKKTRRLRKKNRDL